MEIVAYSLDGCLRLIYLGRGRGRVELRSHLYPGSWTWCVKRFMKLEEARTLFDNQAAFHADPSQYTKPVVRPGN